MALGAYATTPRKGPWPVHQTVCVGRAEVGFRSVSYEAVGYRGDTHIVGQMAEVSDKIWMFFGLAWLFLLRSGDRPRGQLLDREADSARWWWLIAQSAI
jgi:hypothetical protein